MSKVNKLKDILAISTAVGSPFLPKFGGDILKAINGHIQNKQDPQNEGALKELARVNEEQTQVIVLLHNQLQALQGRIEALEKQ